MDKADKAKMEQCLGGGLLSLSLSLSLLALLANLWAKFKGLFYSFCRSFFSSYRKFFLFHRSFNSSFCLQKAFLGHCAFLKFLNTLFLGFLHLSLRAVFAKTAYFVILSLLQKGEKSKGLKAYLPFLDTSLALSMTKFISITQQVSMTKRVFGMTRQISMTNLGCRLNFVDCHAKTRLRSFLLAMTEKWQVLAWNL